MNLREEIAVFEKRLGCRVAFHDLTGEITALAEPEELPLHHLAPCCEEMRSRNRECYERCVQCDTRLIQPHLAAGRPFRKLCHAGFFEAVFPLMKFGAPAGVMFLGVFRPPEGALPEVFQPPEKVVFPPEQEPPGDLIWFDPAAAGGDSGERPPRRPRRTDPLVDGALLPLSGGVAGKPCR